MSPVAPVSWQTSSNILEPIAQVFVRRAVAAKYEQDVRQTDASEHKRGQGLDRKVCFGLRRYSQKPVQMVLSYMHRMAIPSVSSSRQPQTGGQMITAEV